MILSRLALAAALIIGCAATAADDFQALPKDGWTGRWFAIKGLAGEWKCTVAHPLASRCALTVKSGAQYPPGLYRLRVTARAAHTYDGVAWQGGLRVTVHAGDTETTADWKGIAFTRVHQPETKTIEFVQPSTGAFSVTFESYVSPEAFVDAAVSKTTKPPAEENGPRDGGKAGAGGEETLAVELEPQTCSYHAVEAVGVARVSNSAYVKALALDKILYRPGETLRGQVQLAGCGPQVSGQLCLFLEHGVRTRELVKEMPVAFAGASLVQDFEVTLPERRLGHALVAQLVSADGRDRHEKAEYFNIEDNPYRVCILYGCPVHAMTFRETESLRERLRALKAQYYNCQELAFWAPEDLLAISPVQEAWFGGQTGCHVSKHGLQEYVRHGQQLGVKMITYTKFCLYGPWGWKRAYDAPFYHKDAYCYPVGHWGPSPVAWLDQLQYGELVGWKLPSVPAAGNAWLFVGGDYGVPRTAPDLSPYNVRLAAEEVVRSSAMFGWDGVRWDGHPRFGAGEYDYEAQGKAAMLVRYFKDLVNAKYPGLRHGYKYLGVGQSYDWACENFELDELCRGGGLLLNEDLRALYGTSYGDFARIVQTQCDFTRERGGHWLGALMGRLSARDLLVQNIMVIAGGGHPCYESNPVINRYATRFSQYTFDETMRRLAEPEAVLRPVGVTGLWWTPFVFETTVEGGQGELVVNLLNLSPEGKLLAEQRAKAVDQAGLMLNPGSEPRDFEVSLPPTHQLKTAQLIDPFTLEVQELACNGNRVSVPPISLWAVVVAQMAVAAEAGAHPLAEKWGAPRTLGVPHKGIQAKRQAFEPLGINRPVVEVCQEWEARYPHQMGKWWEEPARYAGVTWDERNAAVLASRQEAPVPARQPLPAVGDLKPVRNGVTDIFYARGMVDYNLRLYSVFARLGKVNIEEATLNGSQMSYSLSGGPGVSGLPRKDLLIYVDIPYGAIGEEGSAALAAYVKAGGAALFTGGEYSFGKGAYRNTLLEQEILPVLSITPSKERYSDNRYSREPLFFEPGPDLPELGVKLDFFGHPAFWCWNEVAVREAKKVKVFLKSGNRPVLVGWQVGKGRVACLPVMHKGASTNDATAFFTWQDWPPLAAALLRWLAPDAGRDEPAAPPVVDREERSRLRKELEARSRELALDRAAEVTNVSSDADGPLAAAPPAKGPAAKPKSKAVAGYVAALRRVMAADDGAMSPELGLQLAEHTNLPNETRFEIVQFLQRHPAPESKMAAERCLASPDAHVCGAGYQLWALIGDRDFRGLLYSSPTALGRHPLLRNRYLALAVALYGKDDLVEEGRKRVTAWNAEEQRIETDYTGGKGFSPAAPALPCLGSEVLLARLGWLAYLVQFEPATYASQFAAEWCRVDQYQRFCDWTVAAKSSKDHGSPQEAVDEMALLQAFFRHLGRITGGRAEELYQSHPALVAHGLSNTHFRTEALSAINLLGAIPADRITDKLKELGQAPQPLLADFARARWQSTSVMAGKAAASGPEAAKTPVPAR